MDIVFAPWRYDYVKSESKKGECVFCEMAQASQDESHLILYRGTQNFVVLNKYPYMTAHLMVVPYTHVADLTSITAEAQHEMISLADLASQAIAEEYKPHGYNMGINIGEAAGAGIAEHLHFHVMPRWKGDVNFITTVGNARVIPEALEDTYKKLKIQFDHLIAERDI